jgi:hypothetical protein
VNVTVFGVVAETAGRQKAKLRSADDRNVPSRGL